MEKDTYRWRFYSYYQFCNEFYQQMNITSFLHHCLLLPLNKILFNSFSNFFSLFLIYKRINDSPKKKLHKHCCFEQNFTVSYFKKKTHLSTKIFIFYKFSYNLKFGTMRFEFHNFIIIILNIRFSLKLKPYSFSPLRQ